MMWTRFESGLKVVITFAAAIAIVGCADPRFERASQKRLARIDNLLERAQQKEATAPERLSATQRLAAEAIDRHRDWLQRDLAYLDGDLQHEIDLWPGRWARTVAFTQDYLDGDMACADATIPRLVY